MSQEKSKINQPRWLENRMYFLKVTLCLKIKLIQDYLPLLYERYFFFYVGWGEFWNRDIINSSFFLLYSHHPFGHVCVCMCVCVYVCACMCLCVHVCVCTCICAHVYECVWACMRVCFVLGFNIQVAILKTEVAGREWDTKQSFR